MERYIMGLYGFEKPKRRDVLTGFTLPGDKTQNAVVRSKAARFINAGLSQVIIVSDFDRTNTHGKLSNGDDATVLGYMNSRLSPLAREQVFAVSKTNWEREQRHELTREEFHAWTTGPLEHYVREGLMREDIQGFALVAEPRYGFVSVFKRLAELDVPRIVPSGGIADVIDAWYEAHKISSTETISSKLIFDAEGTIIGYKEDSVVHSLNKQEQIADLVNQYRSERPLIILLGDTMEDADMVDGDADVLRIRIKAKQTQESEVEKEAFRRKTFDRFDLLLEEGDFLPFLDFLDELSGTTVNRPQRMSNFNVAH